MLIQKRLSLQSPDLFYLGLLEIPYFYTDHTNDADKYEFLEKHLSCKTIKARIVELLKEEKRHSVLIDLISGCIKYRIYEVKDIALELCANSNIGTYDRQIAFEYLYELFGSHSIIYEVVPTADESFFEIIATKLKAEDLNLLRGELRTRFSIKQSAFLLKKLISLNDPEGLRLYNTESKKLKKPYDADAGVDTATNAISDIKDVGLISLLLSTTKILFSKDFIDDSYNSLFSSLFKAFCNCAETNSDIVISKIKKLRNKMASNKECVGFCSRLESAIIENNKGKSIKKWSVHEIADVLKTMKI